VSTATTPRPAAFSQVLSALTGRINTCLAAFFFSFHFLNFVLSQLFVQEEVLLKLFQQKPANSQSLPSDASESGLLTPSSPTFALPRP
jgi:hypothetical protein